MKKYIRTDKNIFEVVGETDLVYRIIGASREKNNVYSRTKKLNDVIAIGDSIEELCDELVILGAYGCENPFIFPKEKSFNPLEEIWTHCDNETICYGAIWTDKGLIYVAKINDKGELELL